MRILSVVVSFVGVLLMITGILVWLMLPEWGRQARWPRLEAGDEFTDFVLRVSVGFVAVLLGIVFLVVGLCMARVEECRREIAALREQLACRPGSNG
jgi:hypothetical protein